MCLAFLKPAGQQVPDEYLARAAARHPHGFGIGWVYPGEGQLHLWRSVTDTVAWRRKVASLRGAVVVGHARYATHGPKVKANCHPAWLGAPGRSLVAHNGVLRSLPDCKAGRSDSRVFIDHVLSHFTSGWQQDRVLVAQLESLIGNGNKLVVLNADASYLILNERIGHWANGVWYSNDSYKPVETYDMGWGDDDAETYFTRRYGRYRGSRSAADAGSCDTGCDAGVTDDAVTALTDDTPSAFASQSLWWQLDHPTTEEYYGTVCGTCCDEVLSRFNDMAATPVDLGEDGADLTCDYCGLSGSALALRDRGATPVADPTPTNPKQLALPLPTTPTPHPLEV